MRKPNLSKDGIQQFFLANGEKLLLGTTVVILLGFFYSALTARPLDESMSPEAIKIASNNLQAQVSTPNWDEKKKDLNLAHAEFALLADKAMQPVPATPFTEPQPWNPPLFPELKRRADPKIFAVEELQVASGAALVAYQPDLSTQITAAPVVNERAAAAAAAANKRIDPNAPLPGAHVQSADAQGKPYVVITGLVPVDKEALEYNDRFALAMPAELDPNKPPPVNPPQAGMPEVPQYAVCLIQRREVTAGMKAEAPWPAADSATAEMRNRYQDAVTDMGKWSNVWVNQDIVDPNYIFQCDEIPKPGFDATQNPMAKGTITRLITMPLPPMLLKDWGLEASHPKVRLNVPEDAATTPTPGGNPGGATPDIDFGQNPAGAKMPAPASETAPRPAPAPAPLARTAPPPTFAQATPPRGVFGARGRNDHDERPTVGGGYRQVPSYTYASPAATQVQSVPNKLFRFVDFGVEPGKTYQYRVQLLVVNPNYGLKPECLEKAEASNVKYVTSPMTEPTPPITVPHLYQILAENITGSRGAEPKAKINFWALFKAPASETAVVPTSGQVWVQGMKEIDGWILGSILAVRDQDFADVFDPTAMELRSLKGVSVDTDQPMLLDMRNDDPLGNSKTKGPTEMLIIDAAGNLSVASSAVDHFAKEEFNQMKTAATAGAITQGGPTAGVPTEHQQPQRPATTKGKRGPQD